MESRSYRLPLFSRDIVWIAGARDYPSYLELWCGEQELEITHLISSYGVDSRSYRLPLLSRDSVQIAGARD